MKIIYPKNPNACSTIILETGDYNLPLTKFKGNRVDYIFIPEDEVDLYKEDTINQLISNISCMGVYFGQICTYKPIKKAGA